jgi:hypothetical protein
MKKIKCIIKLLYVINHIIFDFFINLIFLIKQMVKINVKSQTRQTFRDGGSMFKENNVLIYWIVGFGM